MAAMLRERRLVPVAIRNPTDVQKERAVAAGWGVLQTTLVRPGRTPSPPQTASPSQPPPEVRPAAAIPAAPAAAGSLERPPGGLTVRNPVRSGQVVYAPSGDLVVIAAVSSGAELVADGNIHVYGPFRGRALAGVHDNPEANIFCMSLEAEFLSIAGRPLLAEDIPAARRGKPARVHLVEDRVVVTAL
jgi:septum site-determining protein MinC